jgi:site-specific recombinase XerD
MDPGSLRTFVVEFTDHLAARGHTDLTVGSYNDAAHHFAEWLERSDIALADVDDKAVVCADLPASWLSAASRR